MTAPAVTTPKRNRRGWSETLKNFWLDIALFIAFIVDMNTRFTGIPIHEWLGIALGIALIYHLLLHWNWIVAITRRIFSKLPATERLRYILDIALFVDMVIVIATGIWISRVALPQLGISVGESFLWRRLHGMTADLVLWMVALHLALSWKWIMNAFKRYLGQPIRKLIRGRAPLKVKTIEMMESAQ
ncbi:MAG: cytochrome b/b6 domain-containing protein [Chloroflexi bacterium]|nr:cytochrome b/b6 domain-containing protein [Chloroflexota bacterium]MBP8059694.1 cytochrome b/b6 domain-containing protein [Chloroflexota bacterium]